MAVTTVGRHNVIARGGTVAVSRVPAPGLDCISSDPPIDLQAFDHADEADAFAPGRIDVESDAVVDDDQGESVGATAQMHRYVFGVAVLDHVLQRFLNDPEQTQHHIGRERRWHIVVRVRDGEPRP